MAKEFFSLNIAAAVQLFCYECMMATRSESASRQSEPNDDDIPATVEAMDGFYQHLETTLTEVRYLDPENPRLLMRRMRRLFGRSAPTKNEVSMLRGMLSAFQGRKFQRRSS